MTSASPVLLDPEAERAFIRAIHAEPRSLDARLIYADWLDEQHDPRAEYLRLQARFADPREMRDPLARERHVAELAQCEAGLSIDWLSMIDLANRFTLLWSLGAVEHLGFVGETTKTRSLRWAAGESTRQRRRQRQMISEGDYVYPLYVSRGAVYIVARMRVAEVIQPFDMRDFNGLPRSSKDFSMRENHELLRGDRGTRSVMVQAPISVLDRLHFPTSTGVRALPLVEGRSVRRADLAGVREITSDSAFDLDCLLASVDPC